MHPDLGVQRRILIRSYRFYLDADRAWNDALEEARSWYPVGQRRTACIFGDPGSRVRRLYEARDRALQRLLVAREKLENARRRIARNRQSDRGSTRIFLLSD
ncbi:hypothetical protein OEZ71_20090 [Defluviimonas sp. WL0050]|uniref:Transposase n=1 Tax=Albidovulum litorale TaxID=2984134 RepID=A0ABT2ZV79_9RHOB|nr:hypothetical protein [Defluviimonas sp. WL0050]MCV2874606.1 hypothetical protein [Defluviimonas sp. WL0050]